MDLNHINLSAPANQLKEVKDFYCGVLELKEGYRPPFKSKGHWLYADDKAIVHLVEVEKQTDLGGVRGQQRYLDHVAFEMSGIAAFIARLEDNNIQYRVNQVPNSNLIQLFFSDPVGLKLEANFYAEVLPGTAIA